MEDWQSPFHFGEVPVQLSLAYVIEPLSVIVVEGHIFVHPLLKMGKKEMFVEVFR